MKLTSAIKKAEKATGSKAKTAGQFYYFKYGNYTLSFAINGRYREDVGIICIKTVHGEDESDSMTDYFDGIFHDNLTKALKFIGAF